MEVLFCCFFWVLGNRERENIGERESKKMMLKCCNNLFLVFLFFLGRKEKEWRFVGRERGILGNQKIWLGERQGTGEEGGSGFKG